ncbi:hypothetical protein SDC9_206569 [bioreactor metagenome]|uniref:Uncharacterized protein n=1 Tax=bioreactor metagenome TaxID=1076179 RepID=A0A645JGZ2_9ZZZZ
MWSFEGAGIGRIHLNLFYDVPNLVDYIGYSFAYNGDIPCHIHGDDIRIFGTP